MRLILKKKREELGLTQGELAIKIEVARTTYTNIELGEKSPSLKVALKIKKVLNYFNDDIFFNSDVSNRDNIKIQAIRR
jgi:putative transcriptional regulator